MIDSFSLKQGMGEVYTLSLKIKTRNNPTKKKKQQQKSIRIGEEQHFYADHWKIWCLIFGDLYSQPLPVDLKVVFYFFWIGSTLQLVAMAHLTVNC